METFSIGKEEGALRLDRAIADRYGVSVASARRLIAEGAVRVNGRAAPKGLLLRPGDEVYLAKAPERPEDLRVIPAPEEPLVILYEDEHLIALEKPSGVPTHPLRAGERGTVANALSARFPECAHASPDPREAGISHRLDRETSGVLLAARDRETFLALRAAFSAHEIKKGYFAIVEGDVTEAKTISLPLAHHPGDKRRMIAVKDPHTARRLKAQEAETYIEPVAWREGTTLVRASTCYGRMHQIRAHLASAGYPLVGDTRYGGSAQTILGRPFFLHAAWIELTHPKRGQPLRVSSPLPREAKEYFEK